MSNLFCNGPPRNLKQLYILPYIFSRAFARSIKITLLILLILVNVFVRIVVLFIATILIINSLEVFDTIDVGKAWIVGTSLTFFVLY